MNAFVTVGVTFLVELGLSGTETGLVFLIVLLSSIPGSLFCIWFTRRVSSPVISIKVATLAFITVNFFAFLNLANPKNKDLVWMFGSLWGFMLGWYYPSEVNIYSNLMPKGQEAEFAGFALFCSQILGWLPPLVFTLMNENPKIGISWGGVHLNIYFFVGVCFYALLPNWQECVQITESENMMVQKRGDNEEGSSLVE